MPGSHLVCFASSRFPLPFVRCTSPQENAGSYLLPTSRSLWRSAIYAFFYADLWRLLAHVQRHYTAAHALAMAVPNNAIQLAAIPRFIHPCRVCRRCDRRSVELRRSRRCVPPLIRQAVPARGNAYAHKLAVARRRTDGLAGDAQRGIHIDADRCTPHALAMAVPNNTVQLAAIPRFIHPRRVCRRCDRRSVELRRSRRCVPPLIRQAVPARGNAYAHKLAVALTGWRRAPEKRPGVRTRRGRQESALRHGVGREGDVVFSGVGLPHKSLSLFYHRKPTTAFSHSSKASVNS